MNTKCIKSVFVISLLLAFACDEPETTVTNIIYPDGSITRRIEMKNKKNNFKVSAVQVPFDSTWITSDSIAIGEKKDTTWFKTAEKKFKSIDEINRDYLADKGCNRKAHREAAFSKKFKWFNTIFRFSEKYDKILLYGYPAEKFLTKEEIGFSLLPESVKSEKLNGADSTKFKLLQEGIDKKGEKWIVSSLASEWIEEFLIRMKGKDEKGLSREILTGKIDMVTSKDLYTNDSAAFIALVGEDNFKKYKTEIDTAEAILNRRFDLSFREYSEKVLMPGKVIGTNGFLDTKGTLLWPVKDDFFFTSPYEMWAESKVTNIWAWVVSGLFLLFVIAGLIFRLKKR
jgi:hypothetical protein